jgi:hypothetical protein
MKDSFSKISLKELISTNGKIEKIIDQFSGKGESEMFLQNHAARAASYERILRLLSFEANENGFIGMYSKILESGLEK